MTDPHDSDDPKGLIREGYRIDGISEGECRSILVDWALSLPPQADARAALQRLVLRHASEQPEHPMSRLLALAHEAPPALPGRRGGAAGRRRESA